MILDKLGDGRVRGVLGRPRQKRNPFRERPVLTKNPYRIRSADSRIRAMIEIHPHVDLVAAEPVFLCKLIRGDQLKFLAPARPLIEEIPAPAFRCDEHVRRSLAMRIAVKPGVLRNGAEDGAGVKLIPIRQTHRHAFLVQVVRGRLRNQSIDIRVLLPQREDIHREH